MPFVSGTKKKTNRTAKNARLPKNQKVPAAVKALRRPLNVFVITNEQNQLKRVQIPLALPRALTGKISLIISQVQGPHAITKPTMYTAMLVTANHEISIPGYDAASLIVMKKYAPIAKQLTNMPVPPTISRKRRPPRSIMSRDTAEARNWIKPIRIDTMVLSF